MTVPTENVRKKEETMARTPLHGRQAPRPRMNAGIDANEAAHGTTNWTQGKLYGSDRVALFGQRADSDLWIEIIEGASVAFIITKMRDAGEQGERVVKKVTTNIRQTDPDADRLARSLGMPGAGYAIEIGEGLLGSRPAPRGRQAPSPNPSRARENTGRPLPRPPMRARETDEREFSMNYGQLPPFEQFMRDIRRPDPDHSGRAYWPKGEKYSMELVTPPEIELAEAFGLEEFRAERARTGRNTSVRGFRDNEKAIYEFLEYLSDRWDNGDDFAGDLASGIMTSLGYEWI